MAAEDFTHDRYRELLRVALGEGYGFHPFTDVGAVDGRGIFLRHDVDFDPCWIVPMSAIEREEGVLATYCVQPDSINYEADSDELRTAVAALLADGHRLGLHLDATVIADDAEVAHRAEEEADRMAERFGAQVDVVSWHMQGRRGAGHVELRDGLVNAYAPQFFTKIGYVSDSNQHWRGKDLEAILRAGEHRLLQVLVHPMWWRPQRRTLLECMTELATKRGVAIDDLLTPEQRELIEA
jgi:hypothetical protein